MLDLSIIGSLWLGPMLGPGPKGDGIASSYMEIMFGMINASGVSGPRKSAMDFKATLHAREEGYRPLRKYAHGSVNVIKGVKSSM